MDLVIESTQHKERYVKKERTDPAIANRPTHVGIIMDGNGRWGIRQNKTRTYGHQQGAKVVQDILAAAIEHQIKTLTLFALSSENLTRPSKEIQALLDLSAKFLDGDLNKQIKKQRIRVNFIGNINFFSESMRSKMMQIEKQSQAFDHCILLNVAVNYSGRWDIAQALNQIVQKNQSFAEDPSHQKLIETIDEYILTSDMDLLIRTGGEQRISNFLLWQSAYAEIYFSDKLWPDFSKQEFSAILQWYAGRERRFGSLQAQAG